MDDDPAYTMLLKEAILAQFPNADVITTDDGYEALLLIGERRPKVVLLDLKMPKVDGFQVLELLKPRKKDNLMKVVVLSAYIDAPTRERLNKSVADDVLEKNRDVQDILHSLVVLLDESDQIKNTRHTYSTAV